MHLYTVVCVQLKGQEKVQIPLVLPSKVVVDELFSPFKFELVVTHGQFSYKRILS